jgi:hypothetical protein
MKDYPINLYPKDVRELSRRHDDLNALNEIQENLENSITSYALENPENLFDEEYQQILRKIEFSRGLKRHQVVVAPDGFIRWVSNGFPSSLLLEIHNALVETHGE